MTAPKLPELPEPDYVRIRRDGYGDTYYTADQMEAYARAAVEASQPDPWKPSGLDYDRSIHQNPDAAAWADFFVATFPYGDPVRALPPESGGQGDFVKLCHDGQPCQNIYGHQPSAAVTESMVEAACKAMARDADNCAWPDDYEPEEVKDGLRMMRAALTAALSQGGKP